MDYREDIKQCYSSIMEQESIVVNMHISRGFAIDIRPLVKTLDALKVMMVYVWEQHRYGTYKDFFHGKELETKYIDFIKSPHDLIISESKRYLHTFHVRTMFDDDLKLLEKMENLLDSLG